jgi:hypothetical protein
VTVTPLHGRTRRRTSEIATRTGAVAVAGTFPAPSGSIGTFRGSYRLERLVSDQGQTAAAGVFAGELLDADDTVVGTGSRRHTAATVVVESRTGPVAELGPLEVNVLGFPVLVRPFDVALSRDLPAKRC